MGLVLIVCVLVNVPYMIKGHMHNGFAAGFCLYGAMLEITSNGLLG